MGIENTYTPENNYRDYDVVIAGGGLSGIVLARELEKRRVKYTVMEASPQNKGPLVHYLLSQQAATNLGLTDFYKAQGAERPHITGYRRLNYDSPELKPLEMVQSSLNRSGFATISLQELRSVLASKLNISYSNPLTEIRSVTDGWEIYGRNRNEVLNAKIVIDATGCDAKTAKKTAIKTSDKPQRQCYGGVYEYGGPENELLFIDRFENTPGLPPETAGWIMPLGGGKAEVIIAHELDEDSPTWLRKGVEETLQSYINWFNQRGIVIGSRQEVIAGNFSQGLPAYHTIPTQNGFALFGEALGLNHPLNGYLIREIADHAKVMADQIELYLNRGKWSPYAAIIGASTVNYGPEKVISEIKKQSAQEGNGRSLPLRPLHAALIRTFGEDGLWRAIDSGVPVKEILPDLIQPDFAKFMLKIAGKYLELLLRHPQYRHEIKDKARHKIKCH